MYKFKNSCYNKFITKYLVNFGRKEGPIFLLKLYYLTYFVMGKNRR